ncbi:MAG: SDR family NAD(P)-dependent oxidoreductase [Chthonomonadales bacterium]
MTTVLVTGAAGFIGSHVVDRLLERGNAVVGLDNFDPFYPRAVKEANLCRARANAAFTLKEGDITDPRAVDDVMAGFRPAVVVHLAAKAGVRPSITDPASYLHTNVLGTLNLLQASHRHGVAHFVFASSSSVYGDNVPVPFRETQPTDAPASPYAASKQAGERLCYTYHHLYGMEITCLRFFTVYGPRQRPDLAIHKFVAGILRGDAIPLYGDGLSSRDYTYVDDILDGVEAAICRPRGFRIYNLGRSEPVSLKDLVCLIEGVLGRQATIERLPSQPGDVRATCADISRARAELGYDPHVRLEDGIRRFAEWYQQQNAGTAAEGGA